MKKYNNTVVERISAIILDHDPAGTMSPRNDEYHSEAKLIIRHYEDGGAVDDQYLVELFKKRFFGYVDEETIIDMTPAIADILSAELCVND